MSQDAEPTMIAGDDGAAAAGEVTRSAVSPGELLRRARESLNLTIADLAGQTRLSRGVLDALEKNDFSSLAMPVYVRGYFRKCAHVLNLPEDKLLQAYADWTGTPLKPQPLPVTVNEPPREYASPNRTLSWHYVLVIAVVIGAALWWFGSGDETTDTSPAAAAPPMTTLEIEPAPQPSEPLLLPPATEAAPAANSAEQAAAAAPGQDTASLPPPASATTPAASAATLEQASAPAATQPPSGPATLQLNVSQASWVEVYDDDKKRLVYGLLQPGTEQRVAGKLPYQVVLGHPQGVRLSLGGKAIDLARYTERDGTARFEVEKP